MCHFSGPTEWQVVCIRADFQFSECDLTQLQSSWCYLPAGLWWVTFHIFRPWNQLSLAQGTLCLVWLLLTTPASRVESYRIAYLHFTLIPYLCLCKGWWLAELQYAMFWSAHRLPLDVPLAAVSLSTPYSSFQYPLLFPLPVFKYSFFPVMV